MNPFTMVFLAAYILLCWPLFLIWNEWKKFHATIPNDLGIALRIASVACIAEVAVGWAAISYLYFAGSSTMLLVATFAILTYVVCSIATLLIWAFGIGFQEFEEARDEEYYA